MKNKKVFGVIEGFYGKCYSFYERCDLIKFLSELRLNTYVYGPKSDPYHRKEYHKIYPVSQLKEFEILSNLGQECGVDFNYALSPGSRPDIKLILQKVRTMMKLGIKNFSILYDDINVRLDASLAKIQAKTANEVFEMLKSEFKNPILFFCPTQYRGFEETEYILTIAERLDKEINIFWTGRSVISHRITEKEVDGILRILKRPPLIWDNIFANDYIPGVVLRFPYRNREPGIVNKVGGILLNPMNQYLKSKPLIYTAAEFFEDPYHYNPTQSWKNAMRSFYS